MVAAYLSTLPVAAILVAQDPLGSGSLAGGPLVRGQAVGFIGALLGARDRFVPRDRAFVERTRDTRLLHRFTG